MARVVIGADLGRWGIFLLAPLAVGLASGFKVGECATTEGGDDY
ncbi:MAG: hypothetical protein ACFCA4_08200 [Cyanophyceae cyanobacterium]